MTLLLHIDFLESLFCLFQYDYEKLLPLTYVPNPPPVIKCHLLMGVYIWTQFFHSMYIDVWSHLTEKPVPGV